MIKNWLSRYNLRYPRSLVYMLQASEYNIRDYLAWYHKTKNFTRVERRKQFVRTTKSFLLLVIAWTIFFSLIGAAIFILWIDTGLLKYILPFLIVLFSPYILAYGIIIPLLVIRVIIQWPIERL